MQRVATERCGKQRLTHLAFLFEDLLATRHQCLVVDPENRLKQLCRDTLQKRRQNLLVENLVILV